MKRKFGQAALDANDEDDTCTLCRGTGIGQYGDPNTSRCTRCHGTGNAPGRDKGDDDDHVYESWRDRQMERE